MEFDALSLVSFKSNHALKENHQAESEVLFQAIGILKELTGRLEEVLLYNKNFKVGG